jgi:hypothetical protein
MADSVLGRIPVVAGLAYADRVRQLPSSFVATLTPEPGNRYFPMAVAVVAGGAKVGYLAPEIARVYHEAIAAAPAPVTCPGRRALPSDRESSGVELLLDFTSLNLGQAR